MTTIRIAGHDWLTAPSDTPANHRNASLVLIVTITGAS